MNYMLLAYVSIIAVISFWFGMTFGPDITKARAKRRDRKLRLQSLMDLMDSQDKVDEALAKATIRMNQAAG